MQGILNALAHFFGLDNLSGPQYGFWSGVGSDISEVAILGGVIQLYRRHNCHVDGCHRIGKHRVDGTPFTVCPKHHPEVPEKVTAKHIHLAHRLRRHEGTK